MPGSNPQLPDAPSGDQPKKSVLDILTAIAGGVMAFVRKAPIVAVFLVIVAVVSFQQSYQPVEESPQFDDPEVQKEPTPPADLPAGTNPSVWTCVHRSDTQLSGSLWADIYYGMEVRLDGKLLTVKVTEKWKDLSDDKRKTVANLVVDTWIGNSQALRLLNSRDEMEEIVIKRLPEDETVASWKPATGVLLMAPEAGA
ncbi:MAG: hypothetical protein HYZ50_01225 [Deltaproteobacteria bacterium]|nr:hypothetical protein [Deltaproteobacteria bacterium]